MDVLAQHVIDAEIQEIVNANESNIDHRFPSYMNRYFSQKETTHEGIVIRKHMTGIVMISFQPPSVHSEIRKVAFTVQKNKKGKFVVQEGQEIARIDGKPILSPIAGEVLAFNHRLELEPTLLSGTDPDKGGYLCFMSPKKRKDPSV